MQCILTILRPNHIQHVQPTTHNMYAQQQGVWCWCTLAFAFSPFLGATAAAGAAAAVTGTVALTVSLLSFSFSFPSLSFPSLSFPSFSLLSFSALLSSSFLFFFSSFVNIVFSFSPSAPVPAPPAPDGGSLWEDLRGSPGVVDTPVEGVETVGEGDVNPGGAVCVVCVCVVCVVCVCV